MDKFLQNLFVFSIFCLLLFSVFFSPQIIEAETENQLIFLLEIEGEIKAGTYQYLKRVIREAEDAWADYLVIKIDTPGGLLKSTKDIVDLILEAPTQIIVFVHKQGGWAYSAGTFILLAADYAVVHPGASIGAAQPRLMAGEKIELDPKVIESIVSWVKNLAEINQRDIETAEKFVRENLTLTGKEAKGLGVIDETAESLNELFSKLNINSPEIRKILPNPSERLFDVLSHPYLVSLFLTIGGLAIVFAIRTGEFEISGVIGLIALLIGLWGIGVITFSFLGIGLILLGLFLLIMEIFVEPGFGFFGILGAIIMAVGIFTFEAEPFFAPGLWDPIRMIVLGAVFTLCLFFVIIGRGAAKILKAKSKTGPEALIGLQVQVVKTLNPYGQVEIKQEIWLAKSSNGEIIQKGTRVEIIKVEGNTLIVKLIIDH